MSTESLDTPYTPRYIPHHFVGRKGHLERSVLIARLGEEAHSRAEGVRALTRHLKFETRALVSPEAETKGEHVAGGFVPPLPPATCEPKRNE